jgi:hypothetical protein
VTIASGAAGTGGTGTVGAISVKQGGTGGTERIGISTAGAIGLTGNTTVTGTLGVTGASTIPIQAVVAETTNARICTTADCGKLIILSVNDAAAITLPANGTTAGSYIDFTCVQDNASAVTVSSATADTLITLNSLDSDAVTFAQSHRIGMYLRCIAVTVAASTQWQAINLGQTTMGVTDTD